MTPLRPLTRIVALAAASLCLPLDAQASREVVGTRLPSTEHLSKGMIDCLLQAMNIDPDRLRYTDLMEGVFSSVDKNGQPVSGKIMPDLVPLNSGWQDAGIEAGDLKIQVSSKYVSVWKSSFYIPSLTRAEPDQSISFRLNQPKKPTTNVTLFRGDVTGLPPSIRGNDPFEYHQVRQIAEDAKACIDGRRPPVRPTAAETVRQPLFFTVKMPDLSAPTP